jgi:hypothetical protein
MEITSEDHLVLIGNPAKFTTPVDPWMQSFHSGSSAILTPGKSFTGNTREELPVSSDFEYALRIPSYIWIKTNKKYGSYKVKVNEFKRGHVFAKCEDYCKLPR